MSFVDQGLQAGLGDRRVPVALVDEVHADAALDLYELALDPRQWAPARPYVDDRPDPTAVPDDEAVVTAARPYRALETLAPRAWTAQLTLGTFGQAATAATSGTDVAGLHGYNLVTTPA